MLFIEGFHPSALQDGNAVTEAVGLLPVMGHQNGTALEFPQKVMHFHNHLTAEMVVQSGEGLVQQ